MSPADRLDMSFELYGFAIELHRQTLRRRHPGASESEIEGRLVAWLTDRPCDGPGVPVPWKGASFG